MSKFCEHETFRDICGICHRDNVIASLRAALSTARADALEEAARCAELSWYAPNVMYYSDDDERKAKSCAFEAAAAIRALKEGK